MNTILDLHDIQGPTMWVYPALGYVKARNVFFEVQKEKDGRAFILALADIVTTSAPWRKDATDPEGVPWPEATTNISFSYNGLKNLGVSVQTLQTFPDEFIIGMRNRAAILGDDGPSAPGKWDPIWLKDVHIFISIAAPNEEAIEKRYNIILNLQKKS